jgi:lipopolysaccharide export LptBFGC system permease protein LptF
MSWRRAFRFALGLLPPGLREKHGPAMEALFERELERASARGWLHGTFTGAAAVWDVVRRSAYERLRSGPRGASEHRDQRSLEVSKIDTTVPQPTNATSGGPHMPQLTTWQLLRRLAVSFAIAFVALTATLVALFGMKQIPELSARGASVGTIVQVLLLAVPFTAAMTIPMAVFVAVIREFTRLGADGALASARRAQGGVRRLVVLVLAFAAVIAGLALLEIAEIVPPANTRLATMMGRGATASGRTMTLTELRSAERSVRSSTERTDIAAAANYEVEIQKKFALPAACLVLALAGVGFALRVPRGGVGLVLGASVVVFTAYYLLIITGENLALRLVVSPVIGMWGANALLLAVALLAVWRRRTPGASSESGAAVIRG